jgi:hypothetical protein
MKRPIFISLLLSVSMLTAYSQETITAAVKDTSYWKKASQFGINFNQGSFSDTWQGGAVNNFAVGVTLTSKAEYLRDRTNWTNDFQFQYGMLKNKGQVAQKSLDRIFFDSKYGYKLGASSKWYFTGNLNFQSQVANGFDNTMAKRPLISSFFTPAYLTEAIGFEYKPNKNFSLFLSPGALRQTILGNKNLYQKNLDNPKFTNWGVVQGEGLLNEVGIIMLVANYDKDIMENVNLKWRYQAFVSSKDFNAVDNNLNILLSAKVNKYLNVGLGAIVNYDQDQIAEIQYAQSLSVGLLYKW